MPRIEFDGQGQPIQVIALPPVGSGEDLPTTVLSFTADTDFSVKQYEDLGFTHYEVWCVGAAGGRGGDSSASIFYAVEENIRPVPDDVWNLERELQEYNDYWTQNADYYNIYFNDPNFFNPAAWPPGYVHSPYFAPPGVYPPPLLNRVYTGLDTGFHNAYPFTLPDDGTFWRALAVAQQFGIYNNGVYAPGWSAASDFMYITAFDWYYSNRPHTKLFSTTRQALLTPGGGRYGGGGGGGGMQMMAGVLADLPDVVPIVVGKAGADAPLGQVIALGPYEAQLTLPVQQPGSGPYQARMAEINNFFTQYLNSYPLPHPSFDNPQAGQDGGATSFADILCQASGGKGGDAAMVWDGAKFIPRGYGGDGGIGGQIVAGGGASGSKVAGLNGNDGVWRPETGIGGGGGGGIAGSTKPGPPGPFGAPTTIPVLPTAGGRGSFSFAETSVFGQRGTRDTLTYQVPTDAPSVLAPDGSRTLRTGQVAYISRTTPSAVIPGAGGGARPLTNMKYGSKALGYSPDGVVVIRLSKLSS
jgi:hypothetical protein